MKQDLRVIEVNTEWAPICVDSLGVPQATLQTELSNSNPTVVSLDVSDPTKTVISLDPSGVAVDLLEIRLEWIVKVDSEATYIDSLAESFLVNLYDCDLDLVPPAQGALFTTSDAIVIDVNDGSINFQIEGETRTIDITPPSQSFTDVCGQYQYSFVLDDPTYEDYFIIQDNQLQIDTDALIIVDLTLTMSVQNDYSTSPIDAGVYTFKFFTCEGLDITPSDPTVDMFYRIGTGEGSTTVVWDPFIFEADSRCIAHTYQLICTDPDDLRIKTTIDGNIEVWDADSNCSELIFDVTTRTLTLDTANLNGNYEGIYSLGITAYNSY